ncbi:hypothetical protein QAD02_020327 [Eretmocerus hayati]|uniref:Uncharacterized protein n=1 Tax=Eretmocerus hayati TaxID=131215 RepID=A0ACC2PLR5_9HYME|nr:hypothetical protein QAD02_020327 [Eretmocerus hayati]
MVTVIKTISPLNNQRVPFLLTLLVKIAIKPIVKTQKLLLEFCRVELSVLISVGRWYFPCVICQSSHKRSITILFYNLLQKKSTAYFRISEPSSESQNSPAYQPPKKFKSDPISFEHEVKMVAIADAHPNWSLRTLQNNGCAALTHMDTLARWRADIAKKGTQFDRSEFINEKTFEAFKEARSKRQPVLFRNCQEWALQADFEYDAEVNASGSSGRGSTGNGSEADTNSRKKFYASKSWIGRFKTKYRIKQRKITRFVKPTEMRTIETIEQVFHEFQDECYKDIEVRLVVKKLGTVKELVRRSKDDVTSQELS